VLDVADIAAAGAQDGFHDRGILGDAEFLNAAQAFGASAQIGDQVPKVGGRAGNARLGPVRFLAKLGLGVPGGWFHSVPLGKTWLSKEEKERVNPRP
jgi:hypothetical protein